MKEVIIMSLFSKKQEVLIEGMKCEGCERHMEEALGKIEGVKSVKASHTDNNAIVKSKNGISEEDARKAVESCNKKFLGIKKI